MKQEPKEPLGVEQPFPSVLHLSTPLSWRGGEQQLYYLYQELQLLGVKQYLFAADSGKLAKRFQEEGNQIYSFKKSFSLNPLTAKKLAGLVQHLKVDLVHAHDSHAHTIAVLASSLFGMNQRILLHRRVDFPPKKTPLKRWKYNHHAIAKIICISDKIKLGLSDLIKDQQKLTTIHSCVDPTKFKKNTSGKLRRELGLSNSTPIIANIAALTAEKDYPTWLSAAANILKEKPGCHFVAFGGGKKAITKLTHLAEALQIRPKVHFMGHRSDLPEMIKEIDVLMFTSKKEGLGTSLLDAFCCDIPVVATNTGGIPELIIHEYSGLLAKVGDNKQLAAHVLRILEDTNLRKRLVSNARKHLQNFKCPEKAKEIKSIYRQVM